MEDKVPYTRRAPGRPRIIGLTMVKNEQDIIEPMLRHNAGLMDALILLDNGSVDDTRAIALSVARELGNVVVADSAGFGYTQGERMTRLLHAAQSAYFADFILFLDADEFIGATDRIALAAELERIPSGGYGTIAWRNFVLTGDAPVTDPPHGLTHRLAVEPVPVTKVVLRLDGGFHPDVIVSRGSHGVIHPAAPLPGVALPHVPLWHYPIRSRGQLEAKVLIGWLACLAADPHAAEGKQSYHWHDMYRHVVDGAGLKPADLRSLSLHYADPRASPGQADPPILYDPAPIARVRRYSSGAFLDPLMVLARSWEQALKAPTLLFTPEEAAGVVIDIPPFRFLEEKHRPRSVLDVDCSRGHMLELFVRLGIEDVAGVGLLPEAELALRRGGYVRHDPAVGFSLGRCYDLVLCLNARTGESEERVGAIAANADRHAARMIAFALEIATPENLRPWLERWRMLGWCPDLMETLALRCLSSSAHLRRGLVILRRPEPSPDAGLRADASDPVAETGGGEHDRPGGGGSWEDGTEALLAIAGYRYCMPAPACGVHEEPLLDPAEASWRGYVT